MLEQFGRRVGAARGKTVHEDVKFGCTGHVSRVPEALEPGGIRI
jgi:hypothetical protein